MKIWHTYPLDRIGNIHDIYGKSPDQSVYGVIYVCKTSLFTRLHKIPAFVTLLERLSEETCPQGLWFTSEPSTQHWEAVMASQAALVLRPLAKDRAFLDEISAEQASRTVLALSRSLDPRMYEKIFSEISQKSIHGVACDNEKLSRSVTALAHKFGLVMIATDVTHERDLDRARNCGADHVIIS